MYQASQFLLSILTIVGIIICSQARRISMKQISIHLSLTSQVLLCLVSCDVSNHCKSFDCFLSITAAWRWQNGALAVNDNGRISIVPKVEHSRLGHDVTLTYNLTENGGAFTVRIELWRSLPSRTFIERQGYGNESILEFFDDECYYQGWVHGRPRSQVAMSTCEGKVRGTVYDVHGTYYIDYDETSGEHYLERSV